jgi:1,4-alpha-glucan branching enzyme
MIQSDIAATHAHSSNASARIGTSDDTLNRIADGRCDQPHSVLGSTRLGLNGSEGKAVVRTFQPNAEKAWLISADKRKFEPMRRVHPDGIFEAVCCESYLRSQNQRYQIRYTQEKATMTKHDPYDFEPYLSDMDLHLFNEGNHFDIYEKLGAHQRTIDGVEGINFAVWAPNAQSISLVGDFNHWDGRQHPMRKRIPSGVWEIFVPGLEVDSLYKFRVVDAHGQQIEKSDPFGFGAELPPRTASVVRDLTRHKWQDQEWMTKRAETDQLEQPISVYELHPGSWKHEAGKHEGWMNYRDLAHQVVGYCLEMNFTHIELMPITEHPYTGSWGYQTVGYFAPTSRYGTPEDFMYFVDFCHQNGIGVIVDWVPAHFPKDVHGLAKFDGTALYEHADPRQGEHPDWGTLVFNYSRTEVQNFLISNALFWCKKYHIDGLRVDAVASMLYLDYSREDGEWIPNEFGGRENLGAIDFMKKMNEKVHEICPGVLTLAEESTAWGGVSRPTYTGGLGFSIKWNMGWMNDTLRYMRHDPIHRKYHHDELTFSLIYAFTENFMLPFSHDEVVHGKGSLLDQMPGDLWQKFANLRLLYSYMWTHPGKKLMFMGCEWGQWNEWNCDSTLQWDLLQWGSHSGLRRMVSDLNVLYKNQPALYEVDFDPQGFEWVDSMSRDMSVLGYIRRAKDPSDFVLVACNFTPTTHGEYRMGVPEPGFYREIFNSDSEFYEGTNVGNGEGIEAEKIEAQGREWSIKLSLPPLGVTVLKKS